MTSSKKDRLREATAQRVYAATRPANLVPPRTHVNSVMPNGYSGNNMASTRPSAGQLSPNGRAA